MDNSQVTTMQQVGAFIADKMNRVEDRLNRVESTSTANFGTIDDLLNAYNANIIPDSDWYDSNTYYSGNIKPPERAQ